MLTSVSPSTYSACFGGRALRGEVRRSAQLHDALRDLVGMALFFIRVIEKLLGTLCECMPRAMNDDAITQDAHDSVARRH